jgi:glycosyltransferase involved in cell wall biosynthesis
MRRRRVLYLSFDGILAGLGYSQIVRVVRGLAGRGVPYAVVSMEAAAELADRARVAAVRAELAEVDVPWTALAYDHAGTPRAAARNLGAAMAAVLRLAAAGEVDLVHARAYHPAFIAYLVNRATGIPYLFDARSYWIDERATEGRWFRRPAVYRAAKRLEAALYRRARAVVTLTELQAADLRAGVLAGAPELPIATITTCADFDAFTLPERPRAGAAALPDEVRARLDGRKVVGLVGSLNASYRIEETGRLARLIADEAPDAHLLVLAAQHDQYRALLARHGVAPGRYTLARAHHDAMPAWLSCIDWGVLLLAENFAKRASMPTKLAEFLAAGVRPVHHGCNAEVSAWVRRTGTGLVLDSLSEGALRDAARAIARAGHDHALLRRGREIAAPHFSLAAGLVRYQQLLSSLLPAAGQPGAAGAGSSHTRTDRTAGSSPGPAVAPGRPGSAGDTRRYWR